MKKLLALLLALMTLCSCTLAETAADTAESVAYKAYQDLDKAYAASLKYLQEMGRIWLLTMDLDKQGDADYTWFWNEYLYDSSFEGTDLRVQYSMWLFLNNISTNFHNYQPAYDTFVTPYIRTYGDPTQLVWILLKAEEDIEYLSTEAAIQQHISDAKASISKLMKQYPDYPFTDDLKAAYTDATALFDYTFNFNDNYLSYTGKLEKYQSSYHSFDVNFGFIFD